MTENFDGSPSTNSIPPSQPAPRLLELPKALAKAQGSIPAPKKTRKVDFTDRNGRKVKYNYADLADVIDCYRKPLSDNGLAVIHTLEYDDAGLYGLTTELLHASGESVSTWYPLPDPRRNEIRAQEFGSALTYARRYSVSALLGIASEEDDDGENADPAGKKPDEKPQGKTQAPPDQEKKPDPKNDKPGQLSAAQIARLFTIAGQSGITPEQVKEEMIARWNISTTKELSKSQYDELCRNLEAAKAGRRS